MRYIKRYLSTSLIGIIFGLVFLGNAQAGIFQEVRKNVYKFYDCAVVGEGVWLVGERGLIIHGLLGKEEWEEQESGVMASLNAVAFADEKHGWAVGTGGTILRTEDGGKQWGLVKTGKQVNILAMAAVNAKTVWVVGDYGTILCTNDGGATWEDKSLKEDKILSGVCFASETEGWIVGEFGSILATVDAGATWVDENVDINKENDYLLAISVCNDIGVVTGAGGIGYFTKDRGKTWERQVLASELNLYNGHIEESGRIRLVGERGTVFVVDDVGSEMKVKKTNITASWLSAITAVNEKTYVTCGNQGVALMTKDGGENWEVLK
jgi:photosystem II stability/assembly factor-like uncharacterized protein